MISLLFFYRKRAFEKDKDRYFFRICGRDGWAAIGPNLCIAGKTWRIRNGRGIKIGSDKTVLWRHGTLRHRVIGNLSCRRDAYGHTGSNIYDNDSVNGSSIRILILIRECIGKVRVVYRHLKGPYRIGRNLHLQAERKNERAWSSIACSFKQISNSTWKL